MRDPFSRAMSQEPLVHPYDFRRPGKFSKEHLSTLSMVHENFARLVTTYLLGSVRTMVKTGSVHVEQTTFPEFIQGLADPTVLAVVNLAPLPGSSLLEVSPSLMFPILDRLFGGSGEGVSDNRPLTEIEVAVANRVLTGCLNALQEAWRNLHAVTPTIQSIETNPLLSSISALNEVAVSIRVEASLGEATGHLHLCVPFVTLEPILLELSASRWFGVSTKAPPANQVSNLQRRINSVQVPVVARLTQTTLSARQILELNSGDIILLDITPQSEVTILVSNQEKFRGRAGLSHGRRAVRLTSVLTPEVDDNG